MSDISLQSIYELSSYLPYHLSNTRTPPLPPITPPSFQNFPDDSTDPMTTYPSSISPTHASHHGHDDHRMTVTTTERLIEVIKLVQNDKKVGIGSLIATTEESEVLMVKKMLFRERHAVVFYCEYPGFIGKEAYLVVKNELVEWNFWSKIWWFVTYLTLPASSHITTSII